MSRLSKRYPHAALDQAAAALIRAAGADKQLSQTEQQTLIDASTGAERGLVANLAAFARYRFANTPRARLTIPRIEAARDLAKSQLVTRYDANHNGLSAAEMGRMRRSTRIGWLSVLLGLKSRAGQPLDFGDQP